MRTSPPCSYKLLLILLALCFYCKAAEDHTNDVCSSYTAYPSAIDITTSSFTANTADCVAVYSIDLTNALYANKYVMIELTITSYPSDRNYMPGLIGKKNAGPGFEKNPQSKANDPDYFDYPDYYNRRSTHYLTLDTTVSDGTGIYYAAFYKITSAKASYYSGSVSYTIRATGSSTYPCPRSCSGQGTCDTTLKQCVCNDGYIDVDCSIKPLLMTVPGTYSTQVEQNGIAYFYLPIKDYGDLLNITLSSLNQKGAEAEYQVKPKTDYTLPFVFGTTFTSLAGNQLLFFGNNYSSSFTITQLEQQKKYNGQYLKLSFRNTGVPSPVTVQYSATLGPYTLSSNNSGSNSFDLKLLIPIILGGLGIIIAIVLVLIMMRRRRMMRTLPTTAHVPQNFAISPAPDNINVVIPQSNNGAPDQMYNYPIINYSKEFAHLNSSQGLIDAPGQTHNNPIINYSQDPLYMNSTQRIATNPNGGQSFIGDGFPPQASVQQGVPLYSSPYNNYNDPNQNNATNNNMTGFQNYS